MQKLDKLVPTFPAVFGRSYARTTNGITENLSELYDRFSTGLIKKHQYDGSINPYMIDDYRDLFEDLKVFPSGRWMWVGGTDWIDQPDNVYGAYNCMSRHIESFVDDIPIFGELAMCGTGTGASIRDIPPMGKVERKINLQIDGRFGFTNFSDRKEVSEIYLDHGRNYIKIIVGDSRQGWNDAYRYLLSVATNNLDLYPPGPEIDVLIDFTHIRVKGELLKGFGGVANPERLPQTFVNIVHTLNEYYESGREIDPYLITVAIDEFAEAIVAGNIRRCLPWYTEITMRRATVDSNKVTKAISHVVVGDLVETPLGRKKVLEVFYQGPQYVVEIKHTRGVLQSTPLHKHAVIPNREDFQQGAPLDGVTWVKTEDLEKGDLLVFDCSSYENGTEYELVEIINLYDGGVVETFDIEVEDVHCFFAEDTLTHNSAGIREYSYDKHPHSFKGGLYTQDEQGNWVVDPLKQCLRMSNHTVAKTEGMFTIGELTDLMKRNIESGEDAPKCDRNELMRANRDLLTKDALYLQWDDQRVAMFKTAWDLNGTVGIRALFHRLSPMESDDELDHRIARVGFNPCLHGDTSVRVKESQAVVNRSVSTLIGKVSTIWDGFQWVDVEFRVTGYDQKMVRIRFQESYLDDLIVTEYHNIPSGGKLYPAITCDTGMPVDCWDEEITATIDSVIPEEIADKVYCCTVDTTGRFGLSSGMMTGNCGEILGKDFLCNLSSVHANNIDPSNMLEINRAFEAVALMVSPLLKDEFPDERFQFSRRQDPIVGISITGLFDFFYHLFGDDWLHWWKAGRCDEWDYNSDYTHRLAELLKIRYDDGYDLNDVYDGVIADNPGLAFLTSTSDFYILVEKLYLRLFRLIATVRVHEYCEAEGLHKPNRCTTIQPHGSTSLLSGASPGWHPPKYKRYVRRITFSVSHPLCKVLMGMGYKVIPGQSSVDDDGQLLPEDAIYDPRCKEWLLEVPCQVDWVDLDVNPFEFSALAQLSFYQQVQTEYVTHNTSATVELTEKELDDVTEFVYKAMNDGWYISAAFLSRHDAPYPRLPFEQISAEDYASRMNALDLDIEHLETAMRRMADPDQTLQPEDSACSSGACELRIGKGLV